jgi:hypothetical protein
VRLPVSKSYRLASFHDLVVAGLAEISLLLYMLTILEQRSEGGEQDEAERGKHSVAPSSAERASEDWAGALRLLACDLACPEDVLKQQPKKQLTIQKGKKRKVLLK